MSVSHVPDDVRRAMMQFPRLAMLPAVVVARAIQICAEEATSLDEVMGDRRLRHIAMARARIMFMLRDGQGLSFPAIGRIMGRDHTTVMSGVRKVARAAGLIEAA